MLLLNGGQAADAAGQNDTDLFGLGFRVDAAVGNGLGGSGQRQYGKARHLAGFLFVHDRLGVKVFHFTGQLALEISSVELGDGGNAALTGLCRRPAFCHGIPQRVHGAKTGDHDSAFFHESFSFYIAMPPSAQSTCPVR